MIDELQFITKNHKEAHYIYHLLKDDFPTINYLTETSENFNHDLVIVYTDKDNKYKDDEKNLYYVVVTRVQYQ